MNNRQLAQVGLGLLGIWSLLTAVADFVQIGVIVGASGARIALAVVIPVALLLGLGYLLIFHNGRVAMAIFPDVQTAQEPASHDVARTLIALTGVLLLVQASPGALNAILNLFALGATDPAMRGPTIRRLVGLLVPIAAGGYLIARPERLMEYLERSSPELAAESER